MRRLLWIINPVSCIGGGVLYFNIIKKHAKGGSSCEKTSNLRPKKLLILPGGHFDAYTSEDFKVNSAAQRDWFAQHLKA